MMPTIPLLIYSLIEIVGVFSMPNALPSRGTLVVMVPSNEGLIVAADSRSTIRNKIHCDDAFKIIETSKRPRTVAAVTGTGILYAYPKPIPEDEICAYLRSAPRLLDIEAVVKDFLDASNAPLGELDLEELKKQCFAAMLLVSQTNPGSLNEFASRASAGEPPMFSVVLASFEQETQTSVVRSFTGGIASDGTAVFVNRLEKKFPPDGLSDRLAFGESEYVNLVVSGPKGAPFYDPRMLARAAGQPIANVSRDDAIAVAEHLIDAAAKTTKVVPAQSGIGGPIDIVLLGSNAMPERLRWKEPPTPPH